jgi:threonine/homoserine/homoserine lactone efflux protein
MEDLLGFTLAALALAGSPGPNTLSLAATAAAFGARGSLAYFAGITLGMAGVIAIVASGVVGIVLAVPGAARVVTALAALYFVYLAYRIATAPPLKDAAPEAPRPSFTAGFLLSLVNPKGYAAMAALFSGFTLVRDDVATDIAAKFATVMVVILAVNVAWLITGASLTRFMRDPRTSRAINIAFAVSLILSVIFAFAL